MSNHLHNYIPNKKLQKFATIGNTQNMYKHIFIININISI